jgi:hypothetical protein
MDNTTAHRTRASARRPRGRVVGGELWEVGADPRRQPVAELTEGLSAPARGLVRRRRAAHRSGEEDVGRAAAVEVGEQRGGRVVARAAGAAEGDAGGAQRAQRGGVRVAAAAEGAASAG